MVFGDVEGIIKDHLTRYFLWRERLALVRDVTKIRSALCFTRAVVPKQSFWLTSSLLSRGPRRAGRTAFKSTMAAIFDPVPFIRPARNGGTIRPITRLQSPHFGGHVKRLIWTMVGAVHLAAILRNRVTYVPTQIRLSRAAMATIWQNVTLALGLKGVFLVASAFGITGQSIAILADTGATCL